MAETRLNRFWRIAIVFLVAVIIITAFVAWSKYSPTKPIEILLAQEEQISGNIYISGAVANPGVYPFSGGDSISALIQSAGGVTANGDADDIRLIIPQADAPVTSQKININTAEAWLLEALPGIGQVKAKAIIDYRQKNGPFRSVDELIKVDGIGSTLLEQIKPFITVSD